MVEGLLSEAEEVVLHREEVQVDHVLGAECCAFRWLLGVNVSQEGAEDFSDSGDFDDGVFRKGAAFDLRAEARDAAADDAAVSFDHDATLKREGHITEGLVVGELERIGGRLSRRLLLLLHLRRNSSRR